MDDPAGALMGHDLISGFTTRGMVQAGNNHPGSGHNRCGQQGAKGTEQLRTDNQSHNRCYRVQTDGMAYNTRTQDITFDHLNSNKVNDNPEGTWKWLGQE